MKKPQNEQPTQTEGSVLIVGVITIAILCFLLISYLSLVSHQNSMMARSQGWNAALALAEAGVEEALAQLAPGIRPTTNLPTGNGWVLTSNYQPTPPKRDMIGGYYYVCYTPSPPATIYSTGYATIPALNATIQRTVEVKTMYTSIFTVGLLARSNINLNGNSLLSDSYDSSNGSKSNNGQYDPTKAQSNGDVASPFGFVDVGNRNISGTLYLGPTATYSVGPNGAITGGVNNDFNIDLPDVLEPYPAASGIVPPSKKVSGTTYKYFLGGNNYTVSSLNSGDSIYVDSPDAVLYVTGNASLPSITFNNNNGARLKIYVAGASTTMGSVNQGGFPANLQYFGLPSNTTITMNGNDKFVGTIYAPNADMKLSGGGSSGTFWGALTVKTFVSTGNFAVHYDESLKRGPEFKLVAASWREL